MQRHTTRSRGSADALRRGLAPVAAAAARVTAPLLKKRGLAQARIMTEWPAIVGAALAQHSAPERLARPRDANSGVLHLRIAGAWALEFQHLEPRLVERINSYFGYPAVARIRLAQGPLPQQRPAPRRLVPLAPEQQVAIDTLIGSVTDPILRDALASLGRSIARRSTAKAAARE